MKILTVSFRANLPLKNFQHVHVEACAEVDHAGGETPSMALEALKRWVAEELLLAKEGDQPVTPPTVRGRFQDLLRSASVFRPDACPYGKEKLASHPNCTAKTCPVMYDRMS